MLARWFPDPLVIPIIGMRIVNPNDLDINVRDRLQDTVIPGIGITKFLTTEMTLKHGDDSTCRSGAESRRPLKIINILWQASALRKVQ